MSVNKSNASLVSTFTRLISYTIGKEAVDIYRNGVKIKTTANTDRERNSTEDSYVYKVCTAGAIRSNEVTVTF